jgi:hypothetical protein
MSTHEALLVNRHIRITRQAFVILTASYPIAGITAVKASAASPDRRRGVLLVVAGIILFIPSCAFMAWVTSTVDNSVILYGSLAQWGIVLGLVSLGAGLWLGWQAKRVYSVAITTTTGETRVISSQREAEIQEIVQAIETARELRPQAEAQ